jgi:hypothetical protein
MEDCACVDFNNRCDEHKDLVIGPNLASGILFESIQTDGGSISEKDAMGREKFWEDLGRPND